MKKELWVVRCQLCNPATCQYKSQVKIRNSSEAMIDDISICNYINECGHKSDLIQIGIDLNEFW